MQPWQMKYGWAGRLPADQVANLEAVVDVSTEAARLAVEEWLGSLERTSVAHLPGEVYGAGGATVTVERRGRGQWSIVFGSGGEDAFDSLHFVAEQLYEALHVTGCGDIVWLERPYEPAWEAPSRSTGAE